MFDMKRLTKLFPFFALLLGIIGLFLRRWQLTSCFDEQGLPIAGTAAALLTALTAAGILFFLLAVRSLSPKNSWNDSFGSQPMPFLLLPALGALASGFFYLQSYHQEIRHTTAFAFAGKILPVLMVAGSIMAAAGLAAMARGGKPEPLLVMLPGFGSCFWMVNAYHSHASNPVVPRFAWFLLAVVFTAFAWYDMAGFAMERGKLRRAVFFALTSVFLCLISIAGGESLSDQVMLASQAAALTLISFRLTAHE